MTKNIFDNLILPTDKEVRNETHRLNNKRAISQPDVVDRKSNATKQQWLNGRTNAVAKISKSVTSKWEDPKYREKQRSSRELNGQYTDPLKAANFKSPIIGTCIHTGIETVYLGSKQLLEAGFVPANVYNCINGKRKTTGKCTWRRIDT